VFQRVADGELPPAEYVLHQFAEATTAIRVMSAAEHTGKLILDVPRTGASRVVVPQESARVFRTDGSYLITGGLGGLRALPCGEDGRRGLRSDRSHLALPARFAGAGRNRTQSAPREPTLWSNAATSQPEKRRTAWWQPRPPPGFRFAGVLHAAAVVEDATLNNITDDLIDRDWAPKVYGAWRLHQATADQPLNWFCSFSSAAALLGSRGQGAYAAANSWLDAFTHWRRAQGLPASAIAWGAWDEIGRGAGLAEGWRNLHDRTRRRRVCLPGIAAPRPRLRGLHIDHRNSRG